MWVATSPFTFVFIVLPLLVVWGIGIADILRRGGSPGQKAIWIVVVVVLPVIGTVIYFLSRKPTEEEIRAASFKHRLPGD